MTSTAFEYLQNFISSKMKMSHIYQPVMIQTLLRNDGVASRKEIAAALLAYDDSQVEYYEQIVNNMVGKVLRSHQVIDRESQQYELLGAGNFTDEQRATLDALCQEKLDEFLQKRGEKVYQHRSNRREPISGSMRYRLLVKAKHRCQLCGVSGEQRALDIDHIVPKSKGGPDTEENFQVLCSLCNQNKNNTDDTDFRNWSEFYGKRESACLFCNEAEERAIEENELAIAFADAFPVTEGHTLVIPRRHVADYFELTQPELNSIQQLLQSQKKRLLDQDGKITGFNIGINAGESAGQTIFHCHVHLIPRRDGDVEKPRGGVRGVIPNKQNY